jgi:hypothetical protein
MNKEHYILERIIKDLQIRRYPEEEKKQYISRVIYSGLSFWIRFSTLDEDILKQSSKIAGVSKVHILNRCKAFIDNMLELYPETVPWFYPEGSKENPIVTVRDRIYNGGELIDVGFDSDLALPSYKECIVNKKISLIRGLIADGFQIITGLSQFKVVNEKSIVDMGEIFQFYGLKKESAKKLLKTYIKDGVWCKREDANFQVFNKYSSNSFSNCWESDYNLKDEDISLYRIGIMDFGFVKKSNQCIYTSEIKKCLIDKYEVRRFMYGLKSESNNSVAATYRKYDKENLVELKLYNALPEKEENILMLLGWPIKNINDKFNLLFNSSIWPFIETILINLDIILQEDK